MFRCIVRLGEQTRYTTFCLVQRYILLQHDKKYIFSCIHINIFIVKQLHTPEKFNFIVLSANMISSLPTLIKQLVYLIKQLL